ncbi:MAG: Fe2+/Zn2+ uptake regulation protein [Hydrocarboniphaga sp.]|uniref:Fur family transcriptional regulator n=1 Tax=Hydrocarboniphaga sp. TaxID=2033016 RepID=UPI00261C0782|nr:transcriptional repressor [Hydrocarboniphaga sp.]MDB5971785.1 Fe2+/Zn2+ uptake regulation protein [Hydrocarboniphaga sp.]
MASTVDKSRKAARPAAVIKAGVAALEAQCLADGHRLSGMRRDIYRHLLAQNQPQTAYQIIEGLEGVLDRRPSPLSVYRGLDFLVEIGRLHRLESLKAYTACQEPDHHHAGVLFLCGDCGTAEEMDSTAIESWITKRAGQTGFLPRRQVLEVLGTCRKCAG